MENAFKSLQDELLGLVDPEDIEQRQILAQIAVDVTNLTATAATGKDVSGDLAHVEAQVAQLGSEKVALVGDILQEWFAGLTTKIITGLILA